MYFFYSSVGNNGSALGATDSVCTDDGSAVGATDSLCTDQSSYWIQFASLIVCFLDMLDLITA